MILFSKKIYTHTPRHLCAMPSSAPFYTRHIRYFPSFLLRNYAVIDIFLFLSFSRYSRLFRCCYDTLFAAITIFATPPYDMILFSYAAEESACWYDIRFRAMPMLFRRLMPLSSLLFHIYFSLLYFHIILRYYYYTRLLLSITLWCYYFTILRKIYAMPRYAADIMLPPKDERCRHYAFSFLHAARRLMPYFPFIYEIYI